MPSPTASVVALIASGMLLSGCEHAQPLEQSGADNAVALAAAKSVLALAAPSNLTATAPSTSQIDLAWQDNSGTESGFELQRSRPGEAFTPLIIKSADAVTHSDGGLIAGSQYCYRVRAQRLSRDKTTYSQYSNTACATVLLVPPPPTGAPAAATDARAFAFTSNDVTLTWTDNSTGEGSSRIHRSTDGGTTWTLAASGVMGDQPAITDNNLPSEQQVCYKVVTFNSFGDAPASNTACTTPLAAPTRLQVRQVDTASFEMTWSDNSAFEDGYEVHIWFSIDLDGNPCFPADPNNSDCWSDDQVVAVLPANSTSYRGALPAGYHFSLYAVKFNARSSRVAW